MKMKPAVEIIEGDKIYRIYENGKISGFRKKGRLIVINRIPELIARAELHSKRNGGNK